MAEGTFRRPSNALPTGVATGCATPFQRPSDGVFAHTPIPPGVGTAPEGQPRPLLHQHKEELTQ